LAKPTKFYYKIIFNWHSFKQPDSANTTIPENDN